MLGKWQSLEAVLPAPVDAASQGIASQRFSLDTLFRDYKAALANRNGSGVLQRTAQCSRPVLLGALLALTCVSTLKNGGDFAGTKNASAIQPPSHLRLAAGDSNHGLLNEIETLRREIGLHATTTGQTSPAQAKRVDGDVPANGARTAVTPPNTRLVAFSPELSPFKSAAPSGTVKIRLWTQSKAARFDPTTTAYRRYLIRLEHEYNLPSGTLLAQMMAESGGHGDAISDVGAEGLFQFMPQTARHYGINPWDPYQAAHAAARYLAEQSAKFGTLPKALAAYNAGPKTVSDYGGIPPYAETVSYVRRILNDLPTARDSNTLLEAVGGVASFTLSMAGQQADHVGKAFFDHRNYLTTAALTGIAGTIKDGSAAAPLSAPAAAASVDPRLAGDSAVINPLLIASDL